MKFNQTYLLAELGTNHLQLVLTKAKATSYSLLTLLFKFGSLIQIDIVQLVFLMEVDGVSKLIFMSHPAELRFGCVEVGVELGLCNCANTGTMW